MITEYRYQRDKFIAFASVFGLFAVLVCSSVFFAYREPPPQIRLDRHLPPDSAVVRQLSDNWFIVSIEGKEYYAYEHGRDWFFTPKVNTRLVTLDGKFGQIVEDK